MSRATEAATVAALLLLCWILHTWDLTHWLFFVVPERDDIEGYTAAVHIATHPLSVYYLSEAGQFHILPQLNNVPTGLLMRWVFGTTLIGMKQANAVGTVLTIGSCWMLARLWYGAVTAVVTVGLLCASHWLLGFGHGGYNNWASVIPIALSLYCATKTITNRHQWAWAFLAGILCGLGWYCYYTARLALGYCGLLLLLGGEKWERWLPGLLLGFALTVWPLFWLTPGGWQKIWLDMNVQTGLGQSAYYGTSSDAAWSLLSDNTWRTVQCWWWPIHNQHYVVGSLVDPVTGAFLVLGLVVALWRRQWFLLLWLLIALVTSGVVSAHRHVSDARLLAALPQVVMLAAIGITKVWYFRGNKIASNLPICLCVAAAIGCNLWRWYVVMPAEFVPSLESRVYQAVNDPRCRLAEQRPVVVGSFSPVLARAFAGTASSEQPLYRDSTPPYWQGCVIQFSPFAVQFPPPIP